MSFPKYLGPNWKIKILLCVRLLIPTWCWCSEPVAPELGIKRKTISWASQSFYIAAEFSKNNNPFCLICIVLRQTWGSPTTDPKFIFAFWWSQLAQKNRLAKLEKLTLLAFPFKLILARSFAKSLLLLKVLLLKRKKREGVIFLVSLILLALKHAPAFQRQRKGQRLFSEWEFCHSELQWNGLKKFFLEIRWTWNCVFTREKKFFSWFFQEIFSFDKSPMSSIFSLSSLKIIFFYESFNMMLLFRRSKKIHFLQNPFILIHFGRFCSNFTN